MLVIFFILNCLFYIKGVKHQHFGHIIMYVLYMPHNYLTLYRPLLFLTFVNCVLSFSLHINLLQYYFISKDYQSRWPL